MYFEAMINSSEITLCLYEYQPFHVGNKIVLFAW